MNLDKTAQDSDLSNIPAEFRENYRFLSELINCRDKNAVVAECLGTLVDRRLCRLRGKLNKRQLKILNEFMDRLQDDDPDWFSPPVPEELEASIRIKKRSTWLPWEAEAIRKIERWRDDLGVIASHWRTTRQAAVPLKSLRPLVEQSG
jgi:hypothetical protein